MKTTKTIRYVGLCLLILSTVLLMYLFSFTLLKDTKAHSSDQYAVLEISAGSSKFPQTDYDVLFSKLKLVSDSVQIEASASPEAQQNQISAAIEGIGSDHIILFAWKDACIPALSTALSHSGISSVILLSPNLTGSNAMEAFGTHQPNLPIAIFDVNTKYSTSLYERLSGEDATLFPGLKDDGKVSATVFIAPDGGRYLSQWELLGQTRFGQSVLAFLPQVQIKIGEYISTYVYDPSSAPNMNSRSEVAVTQVIKILAVTFLAAGLLMFFASIPKARRDAPDISTSTVTTTGAIDLVRGRAFMLSALTAVLFSVALLILYSLNLSIAPTLLAGWPLLYYAACAVFLFRFFPQSMVSTRIPSKRILFSGCLAFFFTAGIFLLTIMHSISIEETFSGAHGVLLVLIFLMLLVLTWIRMSTDSQTMSEKPQENSSKAKRHGWYQQVSLVIPYIVMLVFLLATGRKVLSLQCVFLLSALLIGIWIRHIFRRTSGTEWLAAIMFSVFYSLIAFG